MDKPLVDRIPFAKIVTALAIVFGASLGLCGLTVFLSPSSFVQGSFPLETLVAGMLISGGALALTCALWAVLAIVGSFSQKSPQGLFRESDETKRDESR